MSDPQTIGDYKVVRQLGTGLMGPVYLATHQNQYWAMRVLDETNARQTQTVGKLVGDIQHEALVRYRQIGIAPVGTYISTDYVDARTISRDGVAGASSAERLRMLIGLLEGVAFLHGKQSVHGNIKLSNTLLRKSGANRIDGLLIDAGFVYAPNKDTLPKLLRRALPGMAPELIAAYAKCDRVSVDHVLKPAVDVYAAGQLVAEVFSGRSFFSDCRTIDELIERKKTTQLRITGVNYPRRHVDLVALDAAVKAATHPEAESRTGTIAAFITALRAAAVDPTADEAKAKAG